MSGCCVRAVSSLQQRRWRKMQSLVADDEDNRRWRLKRACWRLTSSADLRAGRILDTLNDLLLQITWFILAAILFFVGPFFPLETSDEAFPLLVFLLKLQGRAPQNWFDFYFVSGRAA